MMIRVENNVNKESIGNIRTVLEDYFPESNFEVRPFDENRQNYTNKIYLRMAKTFGFFTVISMVIAAIGLFALVSFSSKRKVKEIGIRKVLGASPLQIYSKLTREYLILIFIANIIAIPIRILLGKADPSYYKQEANYTEIFWIIIVSILVTLLTISIQVIKSSRANPVESLRYE